VDSGQGTVDSEQWTGNSGQWTVDREQWTVNSGQGLGTREDRVLGRVEFEAYFFIFLWFGFYVHDFVFNCIEVFPGIVEGRIVL
jgi:hypothetical protein